MYKVVQQQHLSDHVLGIGPTVLSRQSFCDSEMYERCRSLKAFYVIWLYLAPQI